jgi:MFS superfamily sulfate permease-like transporter
VAVLLGIVYFILTKTNAVLAISQSHLVNVPIPKDVSSFINQFSFPNFAAITNPEVWVVAFTIALVASLETLLCVEATDKIDPGKNVTPTNRELLAQGAGNVFSGLIGGLPITQVIVRSSANIQSGGKTKMSTILHGLLLLISVILIPDLLNKIPLSVLASILIIVGFKLAKPVLFKQMYKLGWKQFVPFIVTVVGIVFTDLLVGISLGLLVGIIVILLKSYQNSHFLHIEDKSNGKHKIKMSLAEEVTFFNKGAILKELDRLPNDTQLEINLLKTRYLDNDIIEILEDFIYKAKERNIDLKLVSKRGVVENPPSFVDFFKNNPKSSLSLN